MRYLCAVIATTLVAALTYADTIYVPGDFAYIQDAVEAAHNGDVVLVAPGTYVGTGANLAVVDFGGLSITLKASGSPEETVIDGKGVQRVIRCATGETASTVIEGFTIIRGVPSVETDPGGGILCEYSSPTFIDCHIVNCAATNGGGSYCAYGNPTFINCYFESNTSQNSGGGIYALDADVTLQNCSFIGNSADGASGGAIALEASSGTLTNCIFESNSASSAGAVYNKFSSPALTNCQFTSNIAGSGGGMFNFNSNPIVNLCTFTYNTSVSSGGGMYNFNSSPELTLCDIRHNVSGEPGGGIYNTNGGGAELLQSTVCRNIIDQIYGSWFDLGNNYVGEWCSEEDVDGDGVLNDIDNCYLYNPDQADCNGNGIGDVCDIADGLSEDVNVNSVPDDCECLADIDSSGSVDVSDLLTVVAQWNNSGPLGDVNYDGIVNVMDLLEVISSWGPCE